MIIEENRHDFRQRYRTCSVLLQHLDRDEQVIFYIEDVDEDREFIIGSYRKSILESTTDDKGT